MTDALHIIDQLQDATSNRERAGILLRVPDNVLLTYGVQLAAACERAQFAGGATFIIKRCAGLSAVRDAHGLMPWRLAFDIEGWRGTLSEFAAGKGDIGAETQPDKTL